MHTRSRRLIVALLAAAASVFAACEGGGDDGTPPRLSSASPTSPTPEDAVRIAAQPAEAAPELLPPAGCRVLPPFQTSIAIDVRSRRRQTIRAIAFDFVDTLGERTVPRVIPRSRTAASIPANVPVPLPSGVPVPPPSSSPIPIPGSTASAPEAVALPGRALRLPFTLRFECGVRASGTLFIVVETVDDDGMGELSRTSVPVRG